jgi:hypothetical protein
MAFDNDLGDDLHEERTHSYQQPYDVSFESLAAKAESLNIAVFCEKRSANQKSSKVSLTCNWNHESISLARRALDILL